MPTLRVERHFIFGPCTRRASVGSPSLRLLLFTFLNAEVLLLLIFQCLIMFSYVRFADCVVYDVLDIIILHSS